MFPRSGLNGNIKAKRKAKESEGIFGYTQEEAIGRHITMIIPPELRYEEDRIIENIRLKTRTEQLSVHPRRLETSLIRKI